MKTNNILTSVPPFCQTADLGGATTAKSEGTISPSEDFDQFDLERFTRKIWEGKTVYYETICFAEQEDGTISSGTLLYMPDRILSVRSGDLRTRYEEGKDFTLCKNRILLTKNTRIKIFSRNEALETANENNAWLRIAEQDNALRLNTDISQIYQVAVCYTHSDTWQGFQPTAQLSFLPRTNTSLQKKQPLKIVFYGDSITAGWDASGQNETVIDVTTVQPVNVKSSRPPYTPAWAEIVTQKLKQVYAHNNIIKINKGAGGSTSDWGVWNVETLVVPQRPDLVVIAFGMNEAGLPADAFCSNIEKMIDSIHFSSPETEFLLVSCMMPNCDCTVFAQNQLYLQEEALFAIQAARNDLSIGVVPVHRMFLSLHEMGKLYTDYSSNNVNHPNDFAICIYAQMILHTLGC